MKYTCDLVTIYEWHCRHCDCGGIAATRDEAEQDIAKHLIAAHKMSPDTAFTRMANQLSAGK